MNANKLWLRPATVFVIVVLILIVVGNLFLNSSDHFSDQSSTSSSSSVECPNCSAAFRPGHPAAEFVLKYGYCTICRGR